MISATVFLLTRHPCSRRSAVIRGVDVYAADGVTVIDTFTKGGTGRGLGAELGLRFGSGCSWPVNYFDVDHLPWAQQPLPDP
jgi:hypothetical protein